MKILSVVFAGASQTLPQAPPRAPCQGPEGGLPDSIQEPLNVTQTYNADVGLSQPASDHALLSDQEFCSKHKLPGPDKIVVRDWERPVRAPSKETKGLEPSPNPNWHSSGLDKSSLQTQIQLFKIGRIQSRRRLKKTKGLEPPPNPNWHPSGLDKSSLQTQIQLFKIGSSQSGHRLKKTKGLEPPPNPNRHPSGLDKSSLQTQIQLFKIGSIQSRTTPKPKLAPLALTNPASSKLLAPACSSQVRRTDKKTGTRSEFERTLNP